MKSLKIFFIGSIFALSSLASAGVYVTPRAGSVIGVNNGNASYSVGASAGYTFLKFFSTDFTYTHLFGINDGPNGDTFRGRFVVSTPVGILSPFASLGAGYARFNLDAPLEDRNIFFVPIGLGVRLVKLVLVSASVGAEYLIVNNGEDLVEPYVSVGLHF